MSGAAETDLLERAPFLAELERLLDESGRSGRLMFIGGEAGAGKSALLRRFCRDHARGVRVLWGACDPLFAPRALGPLADVAEHTGGELAEAVSTGSKPYELVAALLRELDGVRPTVLVLEDVHWADEATLDVLGLAARRVAGARSLVLATFRDDELDRAAPLRIVLGDVATTAGVTRMHLPPLSLEAVAELAEPHDVDPRELHRTTGGNPFYVTEVLAAEGDDIPATVRDAVLARAARVDAPGRRFLDAVAIFPTSPSVTLLEAVAGSDIQGLDECLAAGMLQSEGAQVGFRHELARLSIEDSIPSHRRVGLHRAALRALVEAGSSDPSRLAHHAEAAGDSEAVLAYAPVAAERASAAHAHREAAEQYARAVRFADGAALERRAGLFERLARERMITDRTSEALDASAKALACYRELGNEAKIGEQLGGLSTLLRRVGRDDDAAVTAAEAVEVLERLPPARQLAEAYSHIAYLAMLRDDVGEVTAWGDKALRLAESVAAPDIVSETLATVGASEMYTGLVDEGLARLERAVEIGRKLDRLARPIGVLAAAAVWVRRLDVAERYIEEGLEYVREREIDSWRNWLLCWKSRLELNRGRWSEAADTAGFVLRLPRLPDDRRLFALISIGLIRARRGDPEVWPALDEADELIGRVPQLQRLAAVRVTRAEAAWLDGDVASIGPATEEAFRLALGSHDPWSIGELALWRWRAGVLEEPPEGAAAPFALEIGADWRGAAERWTEIGCPYEAALALAGGDEAAMRRAYDELRQLGARPAAAIVARRLRERGARGLARGPRPSTREHPASLTSREAEVLALVAEGLRNTDIADRLFLSPKTVDHHVSAILRKLGVRSRGEAGAAARRLGLAVPDRRR